MAESDTRYWEHIPGFRKASNPGAGRIYRETLGVPAIPCRFGLSTLEGF